MKEFLFQSMTKDRKCCFETWYKKFVISSSRLSVSVYFVSWKIYSKILDIWIFKIIFREVYPEDWQSDFFGKRKYEILSLI